MMIKVWVKQAGTDDVEAFFHVTRIKTDVRMKDANASSLGYMLGYNALKDASVSKLFLLLARIGDGLMRMQTVRIDFASENRYGLTEPKATAGTGHWHSAEAFAVGAATPQTVDKPKEGSESRRSATSIVVLATVVTSPRFG